MRAFLIGQSLEPEIESWHDLHLPTTKLRIVFDPSLVWYSGHAGFMKGLEALDKLRNDFSYRARIPPIAPTVFEYHRQGFLELTSTDVNMAEVAVFNLLNEKTLMVKFYHMTVNSKFANTKHVYVMSKNSYLKFATWYIKKYPNEDFLLRHSKSPLPTFHSTDAISYWFLQRGSPLQEWLSRAILRVDAVGIHVYFSTSISGINFHKNPNKWTSAEAAEKILNLQSLVHITKWHWIMLGLAFLAFTNEFFPITLVKRAIVIVKRIKQANLGYTTLLILLVVVCWIILFGISLSISIKSGFTKSTAVGNTRYCIGQAGLLFIAIYDEQGKEIQRLALFSGAVTGLYAREKDEIVLYNLQRQVYLIRRNLTETLISMLQPNLLIMLEKLVYVPGIDAIWFTGGLERYLYSRIFNSNRKLHNRLETTLLNLKTLYQEIGPKLKSSMINHCVVAIDDYKVFLLTNSYTYPTNISHSAYIYNFKDDTWIDVGQAFPCHGTVNQRIFCAHFQHYLIVPTIEILHEKTFCSAYFDLNTVVARERVMTLWESFKLYSREVLELVKQPLI